MTTDQIERSAGIHDINAIMELLPHRYPFLFIDRVLEFEPRKRIVVRKNVTINEGFFQGHFPGQPVMPGVLELEAIAQAGGVLVLLDQEKPEDTLFFFTSVERARFRQPVIPGDVLEIEVKILQLRSRAVRLEGIVRVDGRVACEAVVGAQVVQRESIRKKTAESASPHKARVVEEAAVPEDSQAVSVE